MVPHRAQRAALQQAFPQLCVIDPATGPPARSAVDTVERFQGGERTVVLVSATESDRGYLLASAGFLLDPRRLTVAVSRAKQKMVLVAARSVFELFSPDAETFANALLWKNLLLRTCTTLLWEGDRAGTPVRVWGGPDARVGSPDVRPPAAGEPARPAAPRRLLLMLRELHRRGYERLRAVPGSKTDSATQVGEVESGADRRETPRSSGRPFPSRVQLSMRP
ncbi:MAG: superfamily helicase [Gemmataceae bacterium]|nr:superfamily helicase [Gemmataceae bacterium]